MSSTSSSRASSRSASAISRCSRRPTPYPRSTRTQFGDAEYVTPSVDAFVIEARPASPAYLARGGTPPPNNEDGVNDMHAGLATPPEVQAAIDDGACVRWNRQLGYAVAYPAGTTDDESDASPEPSQIDPADLIRRLEDGSEGCMIAAPNVPGVIDLTHDDDRSLVPIPAFVEEESLVSPKEMAYFLALRRENINQALEVDQLRMRITNLEDQLRGERRANTTLRNDAVRMAGLYATTTNVHLETVEHVIILQRELEGVREQARRDLAERELNVQQLWRHHNELFVGHIRTVLVNATTQLETLGNQMANVRPFPGVNINTDLPSDDDVFAVMRVIRNMRQRQDEQQGDDRPPEYHRRRAPPA